MRENVGRQFDRRVVEALAEVLKDRRLLSAEEEDRVNSEAVRIRRPGEEGPRAS
jgi:HD-GYP domain-containing protein (c-di-GMP phosphodiesterase class II)